MKTVFTLVALATLAFSQELAPRWGGSGGGGITTTTELLVTYTTACPITEVTTKAGQTYTVTYTTTSVIVTEVQTTFIVTASRPAETIWIDTTVIETYTTLCPVTETITEVGSTYISTYVTTSVVETWVPTTYYATITGPSETTAVESVFYETMTSLCPITDTKTISGQEVTLTYSSTSLIVAEAPTTVVAYTTLAGVTTSIESFIYNTSTSLYAITSTSTIPGKEAAGVYTSTNFVEVQIPTKMIEFTALTTSYETTEVYATNLYWETLHTTVRGMSTLVLTDSMTSTIQFTNHYTVTSSFEPPTPQATIVIPIILSTSVLQTKVITFPSAKMETTGVDVVHTTYKLPVASAITTPLPATPMPTLTATISMYAVSTSTSGLMQVSANVAALTKPTAFALACFMAIFALI